MQHTNVIREIKNAFSRDSKLALTVGTAFGAFVPVGIFSVVHVGIDTGPEAPELYTQVNAWIAAGGLLYSATSVYQWMARATRNPLKGLGWCLLAEGIMTFSGINWLAYIALFLLCFINGAALGSNMALDEKTAERENQELEDAKREASMREEKFRIEQELRQAQSILEAKSVQEAARQEAEEKEKQAKREKAKARRDARKARKEAEKAEQSKVPTKEKKAKKNTKTAKKSPVKSKVTEDSTVRKISKVA